MTVDLNTGLFEPPFTADIAYTMVSMTDSGDTCFFLSDEWSRLSAEGRHNVRALAKIKGVKLTVEQ